MRLLIVLKAEADLLSLRLALRTFASPGNTDIFDVVGQKWRKVKGPAVAGNQI